MSITTEIQNIQNKVNTAYNMINTRGGTLPLTQDLYNMPAAINSIPGPSNLTTLTTDATTFTRTITPSNNYDGFNSITLNGVTANIDSNITSINIVNGCSILGVMGIADVSAPKEVARYKIYENGVAALNDQDVTGMFDDIKDVSQNAFNGALRGSKITGGIYFNNCTDASTWAFLNAFSETNITNFCFPNLVNVGIFTFQGAASNCQYIETADFHSVRRTGSQAFAGTFRNSIINYADFSDIVTGWEALVFASTFNGATINNVNFDNLGNAYNGFMANCFRNSKGLTNISFPNLTNAINNAFSNSFSGSEIVSFEAPNLSKIGEYDFYNAFSNAANFTYFNVPENITICGNDAFSSAFRNSNLLSFKLNSTLGNYSNCFKNAFNNCQNLTDVKIISTNKNHIGAPREFSDAFRNCINLLTVNLCSYNSSGSSSFLNTFTNCSNLYFVNFHCLDILQANSFNNAFNGCTNLTTMEFPSLSRGYGQGFANMFRDSSIKNITFPVFGYYSSGIKNMLTNVSDCVVHFQARMESEMNTQTDVLAGFDGTNTTVLFDLPNVYTNFPIFSESGIIGGTNYAVSTSFDNYNAYHMFDSDMTTGWTSSGSEFPHELTIYSPNGAYILGFNAISNRNLGATVTPFVLNVLGSNDGNSWNNITFVQDSNVSWGSDTVQRALYTTGIWQYYKYHKVIFNTYNNMTSPVTINKISLSGRFKE